LQPIRPSRAPSGGCGSKPQAPQRRQALRGPKRGGSDEETRIPMVSLRCPVGTPSATPQRESRNHPNGPNPDVQNGDAADAQALTGRPAADPSPERRTWREWMRGETWEALTHCQPFPGPVRLARAYRERFGQPPGVGGPGLAYRYSRDEVLELARWLQERQAAAAPVRFRRGARR
jgi:hypothetical protein